MDLTGIGSLADLASTVVNKFFPNKISEAERNKAELEMQKLFQDYETQILDAKKNILVAELNQSDNYTKRARPSVVYMGLIFIAIVYIIFPIATFITKNEMPKLELPQEFWFAWGSVVSVWSIGRSYEKSGGTNSTIKKITGKN